MPIVKKTVKALNRCQDCGHEIRTGPVVYVSPCPICGGPIRLCLELGDKPPAPTEGGETDAGKSD